MASPDAEFRIARWERDRTTCHFHGGPVDECSDDERDWFPQRSICWPTAQLAAANRIYDLLHEERPYHNGSFDGWTKDPSRDSPFHYRDGVSIFLAPTDADPDNDFLQPSVGQEVAGDADEPSDHE